VKYISAAITQNATPSVGANERRVLSRKELAKETRHAMYQSAKARRATDPRYLAMKEAAKMRRRVVYQKARDRWKAAAADEKAKRKLERNAQCASRRGAADRELMQLVTWVRNGSTAQND
jgi:hypothetical protein